jgi:NADH-quinone oxidoreductase subunit N
MGDITFNANELLAVAPQIGLTLWAFFILLLDAFSLRSISRRTLGLLSAAGMLAVLVITAFLAPSENKSTVVLGGMVRDDLFSFLFAGIFIIAGALTCLVSIDFKPARAGGEYFALVILATMTMSIMAAANDMIVLYLATEASSMALYLLAGFMRDTPRSAEAGLKYFVFGAVTSTIMLYGLGLLFGMAGQTGYQSVAQSLALPDSRMIATFALLLIIVGFAFKTSAVPFHFWAPDVYEGAPTPVSGFVSTASKAAGFAILLRFLAYAFPPAESLPSFVWMAIMQPIAILTMFLGNLLAVTQTSVKRMLAYSSIAQAGYMLIGVAAFANASAADRPAAMASVIFYLATYMLTNIGAFAVVGVVSQRVGGETFADFNGLARRSPYLALGMVAALLSLTGAPPLVGFVGKLFIFRAAINDGLVWLVVLGVVNVLISVFYYLGVVRAMYVERGPADAQPLKVPVWSGWVVGITAAAILVTTVASTPVWDIAIAAARAFLLG